MACTFCSAPVTEGARFCSSCGGALAEISASPTRQRGRSSDPASDSDHGRFSPGEVLAGRYRIVERVGKGGMGEVYHADDLTLDHPVALKFLPEAFSRNQERLKRFRHEVRIARQISHPHVCRVYDIGEVNGLHFLSMEYIRGEDLGSLLRRIGRLPPDKAVEIGRQLASGLAAAHDKGVLHRDLKPSNVMIDEKGQARITDFGLAAAAGSIEPGDVRSGTPGFMAPEQLAGEEVTVRSDLYSLGLVLYEVFTGKRAFETFQRDTPPASPSSIVEGLDPAVERVILRCLEKDPRKRPPSASTVGAAFPGGDPLAAAIAAGKTPAPELVAEAGEFAGLKPLVAWTCLTSFLALLALGVWMSSQTRLSQIVPLTKPPELLVADAHQILENLGYPTPQRDSTYGFSRETGYIDHLMKGDRSSSWWALIARGEPAVLRFWYRESPQFLVPHRITEFLPAEHDPPSSTPGMVFLQLDTFGHLRHFEAVPFDFEAAERGEMEPAWSALFAAAGFDEAAFTSVKPRWVPSVYADRRAAWEGVYPGAPEIPIRIEAAARGGRPVHFRIIEPWTEPGGAPESESPWARPSDAVGVNWARLMHIGLNLLFMLTLALLARRNMRLGRGDRKLSFRLALFLFSLVMLHWLFGAHHVPERSEVEIFFGGLYRGFFTFVLAWLFYMALEPYARRLWPRTMVSWVRLFNGRFRDPLVGRDLLLGCLLATSFPVLLQLPFLAPRWMGLVPPRPDFPLPSELPPLRGFAEAFSQFFVVVANNLTTSLYIFAALVLLRFVLRKTWLAAGVWWVLGFVLYGVGFGMGWLLANGVWWTLWVVSFFRFGWLATVVAMCLQDVLLQYPVTMDLSAWYAYATFLALGVALALAVYGFKVSLAGQPAFGDILAEE